MLRNSVKSFLTYANLPFYISQRTLAEYYAQNLVSLVYACELKKKEKDKDKLKAGINHLIIVKPVN